MDAIPTAQLRTYFEFPKPQITALNPQNAPARGGATVTVQGSELFPRLPLYVGQGTQKLGPVYLQRQVGTNKSLLSSDSGCGGTELMQDSANDLFFEVPAGTGVGLPLFLDGADKPYPDLQFSYCPCAPCPLSTSVAPWELSADVFGRCRTVSDHAGLIAKTARSAPGRNGARAHRHAVTMALKPGLGTSSSHRPDPESLARARMSRSFRLREPMAQCVRLTLDLLRNVQDGYKELYRATFVSTNTDVHDSKSYLLARQ